MNKLTILFLTLLLCGHSLLALQTPKRTPEQQKAIDLINTAVDLVYAAEYDSAKALAERSLEISERINFVTGRGMYERLIGTMIQAQGDIPGALERYYTTLELYKADGYHDGVASVKIDLGSIALDRGDVSKARRFFTESQQLYQELNDTTGVAANYINLGLVYDAEKNYDANLANLKKAADLFKSQRDSLRLGIALNNSSAVYHRKGRIRDALEHRQMAIRCFEVANRQDMVRKMYAPIGETYRRLGKLDSARIYLERGLELNLAADDKSALVGVYDYLSVLDSTEGRYREALYNRVMWAHYREIANGIKKNSEITRTEMRHEFRQKEAQAQQELDRERMIRNGMLGGVATLFAFTVVFFRQRNKVKREKARSEELLLNILPAETAEELKATGTATARQYGQVTVLFTDFVNFTGIAESLTPTELVAEVHRIFTAIDAIIEKHGLEKIKTIGDAYLAVCGLPMPAEDHALRVVRAAQDIVAHMAEHNSTFQIRIGINSGPVVAGIVGVKKFAYDIWGDTVNTASRMEIASEPGRINLSESTYELIKDHVTCEYRGMIDVKGKGAVGMYYVAGTTP